MGLSKHSIIANNDDCSRCRMRCELELNQRGETRRSHEDSGYLGSAVDDSNPARDFRFLKSSVNQTLPTLSLILL